MIKTASISDLRGNLKGYIDELPSSGAVMVVRKSSPAAYLLSPSLYEELLRHMEEAEDVRDMFKAIKDFQNGEKTQNADDLFKELGI